MATKRITAAQHRERARILRMQAIQIMDVRKRQEFMLLAIEHEFVAEELEQLNVEEEA